MADNGSVVQAAGRELWSGVLNVAGGAATLWVVKRLLSLAGPEAYGTVGGNFKVAGIMLLGTVASGLFVMLGEYLFISRDVSQVKDEERNSRFWPLLMVMLLCFCGITTFVGRALLVLVGVVEQGAPPPDYLEWMFRFLEQINA